ncbi:hypothetical protein JOD57_004159 [Geodermatophilus bullaregiensis]|nr:hypothetical protein [Geodermatophilus bullaregiensis]
MIHLDLGDLLHVARWSLGAFTVRDMRLLEPDLAGLMRDGTAPWS